MKAYTGTFTANTGTGVQTVTGIVDENGTAFTPTLVLLWSSYGTTTGFLNGWWFVIGAMTSSQQFTCATVSDDANAGTQRAASQYCGSNAFLVGTPTSTTSVRTGDFSAFASGQFAINWTKADGVAPIIHYVAFGGSDLVLAVNPSLNFDSTNTPTTIAGTPVGVLSSGGFNGTSGGTGTAIGWFQIPAYTQGVAAIGITSSAASAPSRSYERTDETRAFFTAANPPTMSRHGSADVFGTEWAAQATSANVFWSSIAFAGIQMAAGSGLQPTSTGTQAITGVGFPPKLVLIVTVMAAASSAAITNAAFCLGAADRTRQGYALAAHLSAQATSVTVNKQSTTTVIASVTPNATAGSSTTNAEASLQSMDTDGFTLNWTTADATQREYIWLAFGDRRGVSYGFA